MSINTVVLLGNCGADPEIRRTQAGQKVANIRLATSEYWKDKATGEKRETTEWHRVVVFNEHLAEMVEKHVKKGSKIHVTGKLATKKWQKDGQDHYTTEVVVGTFNGTVTLEGGGQGSQTDERGYGTTSTREPPAGSATGPSGGGLDDQIPF